MSLDQAGNLSPAQYDAEINRLNQQIGDMAREIERLRDVLARLSNRHAGYEHAMGPCICEAHVEAREILESDK